MTKQEFEALKVGDLVVTHRGTNLTPRAVTRLMKDVMGNTMWIEVPSFRGKKPLIMYRTAASLLRKDF